MLVMLVMVGGVGVVVVEVVGVMVGGVGVAVKGVVEEEGAANQKAPVPCNICHNRPFSWPFPSLTSLPAAPSLLVH
jgi:hypothetical protein